MRKFKLSSNILRESLKTFSSEYIIVSAVDVQKPENLGDYVRRIRNEKGLSTIDVERHSQRTISSSYVTRLENEPSLNPSWKKLQALAKGLGVSEDEIVRIASGQSAKPTNPDKRFELISLKFKTLKGEDRREVETIVEILEREIERRANSNN